MCLLAYAGIGSKRVGHLVAEVRNEGSRTYYKLRFLLALLGSNGICLVAMEVPTFKTLNYILVALSPTCMEYKTSVLLKTVCSAFEIYRFWWHVAV